MKDSHAETHGARRQRREPSGPSAAPRQGLETSGLPEGWAETTVGEVAEDISYGFTARATTSPVGPRMLRITDIQNGSVKWNTVPYCAIPKSKAGGYTLREGDIVFARTGATTGKSFLIHSCPEAVFASYLIRVRPSEAILPQYAAHFFQSGSYWKQISANITGSAQPNCNASKVATLSLALAPLAEQGRIVAKLETLLGRVDTCQKRLAMIPVLLNRFRQSVLAAACSGRLTADWREHNPADQGIDAIVDGVHRRREAEAHTAAQKEKLRQIFSVSEANDSAELPASWRFISLSKLCSSFDYGTSVKSQPSGTIPVLRMGNIQSGRIDWTDLAYTSDTDEIESYSLRPNTVLFNRTNSPELVGKTALYRGEQPAIFAGYLIRINPFPELNPEYLNLCLNTNYAREFCAQTKTDGVSQSNINAKKLGTFEVPLCPLAEQQEIVRRVEALFALAERLEAGLAKARQQVDRLMPSLLTRAFRGELVPTEAELAEREGRDYEPAAALLDRIQRDRTLAKEKGSEPRACRNRRAS
jgi:type I restriction enzyme, S subunit